MTLQATSTVAPMADRLRPARRLGRILVLIGIWFVILGLFADEFAGVFSV